MTLDLRNFDTKRPSARRVVMVAVVMVVLLITVLVLLKRIHGGAAVPVENVRVEGKKEPVVSEVKVRGTEEVISEDVLWRNEVQERLQEQERTLSTKISEMNKDIDTIEKKTPDSKQVEMLKSNIAQLEQELRDYRRESDRRRQETTDRERPIAQYVLNLETKERKLLKTVDNYIPAGSFAKAVLLSGVDASTALHASADPDPVLIRVTDHGTLPRRFKSDLKDCHIIAYAYGDLSSERAKIRVEKLSCTEVATGEIVETAVAGYVSGPDGRQGIRGTVVSVDEKILGHAFLAGTLGGLANNFNTSTAYRPADVLVEGKYNNPSFGNRLQDSFAEGGSSGLDRLAKYYIERAESIVPVVQIAAGTEVEVIFTEGVFIGTTEVKHAIAEKREVQIQNEAKNALVQPLR